MSRNLFKDSDAWANSTAEAPRGSTSNNPAAFSHAVGIIDLALEDRLEYPHARDSKNEIRDELIKRHRGNRWHNIDVSREILA